MVWKELASPIALAALSSLLCHRIYASGEKLPRSGMLFPSIHSSHIRILSKSSFASERRRVDISNAITFHPAVSSTETVRVRLSFGRRIPSG